MALNRNIVPKKIIQVNETDIEWIKTTLSSMSLKHQ